MSLSNEKISVQPLICADLSPEDFLVVQQAWGELLYRSVEAISASLAGVEDFAEECVYLGLIIPKSSETVPQVGPYTLPALIRNQQSPWSSFNFTNNSISPVGIIYLKSSALPGTFDIGLSIVSEQRGKRWGREAVRLLMKWAFEELHCHRIQARVLDSDPCWRAIAIGMFTHLGFNLEGTSRRALFCPSHPLDPYPDGTNGEWRDVTNLSLLDVDWVMYVPKYDTPSALVKYMWEGLFAREERERAELIRFEEEEEKRRRSSDTDDWSAPPRPSKSLPYASSSSSYPPWPFSTDSSTIFDKGKGGEIYANDKGFLQTADHGLSQLPARVSNHELQKLSCEASTLSSSSTLHCAARCITPDHGDDMIPAPIPTLPHASYARLVSPESPTGTALTFDSDDGGPFSDVESVPRSASVVSDVNTDAFKSGSESEEWDDAWDSDWASARSQSEELL